MVGTIDFGVNRSALETRTKTVGNQEIVDAPSSILLSCTEAVGPPAVGHLIGMKRAEGVDEAIAQQLRHALALLVGESGIAAVSLGVLDIYLLVGHVHVAADHDRFLLVQFVEIGLEVVLPVHSVVEPAQLVLRVRR